MFGIWPRNPWNTLGLLAAVYLGVAGVMMALQRRLIYFPARYDAATAHSRAAAAGLVPWGGTGGEYVGFLAEPRDGRAEATAVVFHGNAADAPARAYYATALLPRRCRVLLAEYPGYGARPGQPGEAACVADGLATVRRARDMFGGPLIVIGESLGAGVAAGVAAAAGTNTVDGLVLITPWDSLTRLAQQRYRFLPVRWMLRDRYDSVRNANAYGGPVAVVTAENDTIVPRRNSESLFEALRVPKLRRVLPSCGHNDWPCQPGETWWDEVLAFLRR